MASNLVDSSIASHTAPTRLLDQLSGVPKRKVVRWGCLNLNSGEEGEWMQTISKRAQLRKPVQLSIFRRDGWLCHWCHKPVIFAPVMKYIEIEMEEAGDIGPHAYYHAHWTRATAPLLDELGAVLDHVSAFSKGGACKEDNLVTACSKCNVRKSAAELVRWEQREKRKAIKGKYGEPTAWDGLSGLFVVLAQRHLRKLSAGEREWLKALQATS